MIEFNNTVVSGFDVAIRGARNSYDSWDKSDSIVTDELRVALGKSDAGLLRNLVKAGDSHGKCMRAITVSVDITAPLTIWKQIDTYKVGTVTLACSTMHTITKKEFSLGDFSCEHALKLGKGAMQRTVDDLNTARNLYINWDVEGAKYEKYNIKKDDVWNAIIEMLPESYNQMRTLVLNYQVLRHMYHDRKEHKLGDWHEFCKWVKGLPYADILIVGETE